MGGKESNQTNQQNLQATWLTAAKKKIRILLNPLYSDGFSNTDTYNKDGIVHYIF